MQILTLFDKKHRVELRVINKSFGPLADTQIKTGSGNDGNVCVWQQCEKKHRQSSDRALCLSQECRLQTKLTRSAAFVIRMCMHMCWETDLSADAKRCLAYGVVWSSSLFSSFPGGMSRKWVFSALSLCRLFEELCRHAREWQRAKHSDPPGKAKRSIWI